MKTITISEVLESSAAEVWAIFSNLSRSDWVPGVEEIKLNGDERTFKMEGMGDLVEKILSCDHEEMELKYSAIKTAVPIKHHLAVIKITPLSEGCRFDWTTEIDPEMFAESIHSSMKESFSQLKIILKEP
jgi:hypothetical protein